MTASFPRVASNVKTEIHSILITNSDIQSNTVSPFVDHMADMVSHLSQRSELISAPHSELAQALNMRLSGAQAVNISAMQAVDPHQVIAPDAAGQIAPKSRGIT